MPSKIDHIVALARAVGPAKALKILLLRALQQSQPINVTIGSTRLLLRPCESDLFVLGQIFGLEEYGLNHTIRSRINMISSLYKSQGKTPLIVDAGANVGYSSIYFSNTYSEAHIIAIEPDYDTFLIMKQNCSGRARITPIHAALWKHNDGVNLRSLSSGSWSRAVADNGTIPSRTLQDILSIVPNYAPLLLKMDIEGAEKETVEVAQDIVRSFPVIMIEPHDFTTPGSACLSPLYSAISGKSYDTLLNGENLILLNIYVTDDGAARLR